MPTLSDSPARLAKPCSFPRLGNPLFWLGCFAAPIALLVFVSIWNGVYPFGAESFLTEDLKYQYIDFFTWYRRMLLGDGNIFYSFSQALGSNTWGLFSYYLSSPFNLLVVFFDNDHLVLFVYIVTALKLGCIQLFCAWFLLRRFRIGKPWAFTLSLCFAWCSWVTTQLRNPMWLDALILLPIMAYACHLLIRDGKALPLAIASAADIMICWYMAYISILFTCLYVLFELACHVWDEKQSVTGRWVLGRALRFIGAMALALLLSAWTFLPTVLAMMGSSPAQELEGVRRCGVMDLLRGFLPGGYRLDRTPQFFTGTLVTLLAFAFLLCRRIDGRLRASALALLAFLIASSVFAVLEFVWCGMRVPTGFYSRTTFLASFLAIWMAARYLQQIHETPLKRKPILPPAAITAACGAVVLLSSAELLVNAHLSWKSIYTEYSQEWHDSYVSAARVQLDELGEVDPSAFYRIDKTYARAGTAALEEGLALGFDQLSSYSSTTSPKTIRLLSELGYSSDGKLSVRYSQPLLSVDSLFGVRYAAADQVYSGYVTTGGVTALPGTVWSSNPYALSLAYAVSDRAAGSAYPTGDDPFERQNALFSTLLGEEVQLYRPLEATEAASDSDRLSWTVEVPAGCIGYAYVVKGQNAGGNSILNMSTDGASPVPEGWRFDHTLRQIAPEGDTASTHTVTISRADPAYKIPKGTTCLFYALDMDVFESAMDELAARQATVESFTDGRVSLGFSARHPTTLLLTVPYDKGWSVQVNGKSAELEPALGGGLSTIELPAGDSEIRMTYRSPGFAAGCVVSAATAGGTVAACAVSARRKKH